MRYQSSEVPDPPQRDTGIGTGVTSSPDSRKLSTLRSVRYTHWIWQDEPYEIVDGYLTVPDLDDEAVAAAHELYQREGLGGRDDAVALQFLIPGWSFDSKRPALQRG